MRALLSHTRTFASLATAVLGGVLLGHSVNHPMPGYAALSGLAAAAAWVAATLLATRDSFGARLLASVVTAVTGIFAFVAMCVGAPGAPSGAVTLEGATLVACGVLVPVLVAASGSSGLPRDR